MGESERRIRDLFTKAKKAAPCILFFDEIESIFKNRKNSETSYVSSQLLTQLLLQIDSISSENTLDSNNQSFVFIIGATNIPEVLLLTILVSFIATGSIVASTRKTGQACAGAVALPRGKRGDYPYLRRPCHFLPRRIQPSNAGRSYFCFVLQMNNRNREVLWSGLEVSHSIYHSSFCSVFKSMGSE